MEPVKVISPQSCQCPNGCRTTIRRIGHYQRKSDGVVVQRYQCTKCGKSFSDATNDPCYGQKKRHFNELVFKWICSCASQRRIAFNFNINIKTVARKIRFLAEAAGDVFAQMQQSYGPVREVQFDDFETHEHSKCKPISVTIAVIGKERQFLGFRVSRMPAKGKLAEIGRKKYGRRRDERRKNRRELFAELQPLLHPQCVIRSDQNPHYTSDVKEFFPGHLHKTCKGQRGCVTGQGELKRGGFDPLFTLNHNFATIRDNLKTCSRRTWCTTKKVESLRDRLILCFVFHNGFWLPTRKRTV